MIVRTLDQVRGTERDVTAPTWRSTRLLVAGDAMGFSLHDTTVAAGTTTPMWYRHHVEAVYCIDGHGTVEDLATGETHPVAPGTLYALDRHDRHVLRAETDLRVVCVFNPPCAGTEAHDDHGGYPPPPEGAS